MPDGFSHLAVPVAAAPPASKQRKRKKKRPWGEYAKAVVAAAGTVDHITGDVLRDGLAKPYWASVLRYAVVPVLVGVVPNAPKSAAPTPPRKS